MKKLFVVLFLVVVGSTAFSQAQLALGLKGGLNFANLDVSSAGAAYNSRTGYHGGAFFLVKLGKIGIQPELLFSKQGSNVSFSGQDLNSNFDYINIPVIFKLYTVAGINLQVGPQLGFLAGGSQDQLVQVGQALSKVSTNASDVVKSNDFSLALGLGWDLPFGLTIDGRYNLGLSNNNKISGSSSEVKNQVIQVSLGYKLFKFGK